MPSGVAKVGTNIAVGASELVSKTEGLHKITKVFIAILQMVFVTMPARACKAGVKTLIGRLAIFRKLHEALSIFSRIKEWSCKDAKGKRMHQYCTRKSWGKMISRIFLTIGNVFQTLAFLSATGLVRLGRFASSTLCNTPILSLVIGATIGVSAGFSIVDQSRRLVRKGRKIKKANEKLVKWQKLSKKMGKYKEMQMGSADANEKKQKIMDLHTANIAKWQTKFDNADGNAAKQAVIQEKMGALTKLNGAIDKGDADSLKRAEDFYTDKARQWSVFKSNTKKAIGKSWLSIANDVGKLVMIVLGTILAGTLGMGGTIPLITMAAFSLITGVVGCSKFLYGSFWKPQQIPQANLKEAPATAA